MFDDEKSVLPMEPIIKAPIRNPNKEKKTWQHEIWERNSSLRERFHQNILPQKKKSKKKINRALIS